jgi:hypothetical protein
MQKPLLGYTSTKYRHGGQPKLHDEARTSQTDAQKVISNAK